MSQENKVVGFFFCIVVEQIVKSCVAQEEGFVLVSFSCGNMALGAFSHPVL